MFCVKCLYNVNMSTWKEFLEDIYFKIDHPGSFSGPNKVQKVLSLNGYTVSLGNIREWLQSKDAYSLFKPTRYRFKRDRVVTCGIDDMWDADLADVSNTKIYNNDVTYLLILIDVFSRYLWIEPLKDKSGRQVAAGFKTIFMSQDRKPKRIRSDKGREFTNQLVKQLMKSSKIKSFTTKNETKANFAERVIKTIKALMYRYFLKYQTYRYIDVLQDLVHNYNNTPHSSLKNLSPAEINSNNEAVIWKRMYVDTTIIRKNKYKFKKGDKVRISHLKYQFQRDYHQKWTEEYFVIQGRKKRMSVNVYFIKDLLDDHIDGIFYEPELQKVTKNPANETFRIEKVLKRKKRRGKEEELFIKWMGWPKKFNSWVVASDIQKF